MQNIQEIMSNIHLLTPWTYQHFGNKILTIDSTLQKKTGSGSDPLKKIFYLVKLTFYFSLLR